MLDLPTDGQRDALATPNRVPAGATVAASRLAVSVPVGTLGGEMLGAIGSMLDALPAEYLAGARLRIAGEEPRAARVIAQARGIEFEVVPAGTMSTWDRASVELNVGGTRVTLELPVPRVDQPVVRAVGELLEKVPAAVRSGLAMDLGRNTSDETAALVRGVGLAHGVDVSGTEADTEAPIGAPTEDVPPHGAPLEVRPDIRYSREAKYFENQLAEYLTGDSDIARRVNEQIRVLVEAAWQTASPNEKWMFGTDDTQVTGMVGRDMAALDRVVRSGNLRERMAFLYNAYTKRQFFHPKFNSPLDRHPEIMEEQRRDRRDAQTWAEFDRTQDAIDADPLLSDQDKDALLDALRRRLIASKVDPGEVRPPLSQDERAAVVDEKGRLRWSPGEYLNDMPLRTRLQQRAEATGGLVATGTAGTADGFMQVIKGMSRYWNVPVDPELVRLALLAWMIPAGDHTFHEIMRASALVEPSLRYSDHLGRYWDISPLTEQELRAHVARDGKFPDEHRLEVLGEQSAFEEHGDSEIPPPPLSLEAVLGLTDVSLADGGDGTPEHVWMRTPDEAMDPAWQDLVDGLQVPAGHVALQLHGVGGRVYVGGREVTPEIALAVLDRAGAAGRPIYLMICEAGAGDANSFAQRLADLAQVPVVAADSDVWVNIATGIARASSVAFTAEGRPVIPADGTALVVIPNGTSQGRFYEFEPGGHGVARELSATVPSGTRDIPSGPWLRQVTGVGRRSGRGPSTVVDTGPVGAQAAAISGQHATNPVVPWHTSLPPDAVLVNRPLTAYLPLDSLGNVLARGALTKTGDVLVTTDLDKAMALSYGEVAEVTVPSGTAVDLAASVSANPGWRQASTDIGDDGLLLPLGTLAGVRLNGVLWVDAGPLGVRQVALALDDRSATLRADTAPESAVDEHIPPRRAPVRPDEPIVSRQIVSARETVLGRSFVSEEEWESDFVALLRYDPSRTTYAHRINEEVGDVEYTTGGPTDRLRLPWDGDVYFAVAHGFPDAMTTRFSGGRVRSDFGYRIGLAIREDPAFRALAERDESVTVVLLACETGLRLDGPAQRVANAIGAGHRVFAPTGDTGVFSDGELVVVVEAENERTLPDWREFRGRIPDEDLGLPHSDTEDVIADDTVDSSGVARPSGTQPLGPAEMVFQALSPDSPAPLSPEMPSRPAGEGAERTRPEPDRSEPDSGVSMSAVDPLTTSARVALEAVPVTLPELRQAVQVVWTAQDGTPSVIRIRPPGEPIREVDHAAFAGLIGQDGSVVIDMHGRGGQAYLGGRPVYAADLDVILQEHGLVDRPLILNICQADRGPDSLAEQLASLRGVRVRATSASVFVDAASGITVAAEATVLPSGALSVTTRGQFVDIVVPDDGVPQRTPFGFRMPPGADTDVPLANGAWTGRMPWWTGWMHRAGTARATHGLPWLPRQIPTNTETVELHVGTHRPPDLVLTEGIPSREPYLIAYTNPLDARGSGEAVQVVKVRVPAGAAVPLAGVTTQVQQALPPDVHQAAGATGGAHVLPHNWLGQMRMTEVVEVSADGQQTTIRRWDEPVPPAIRLEAPHGIAGVPQSAPMWRPRNTSRPYVYLLLPSAADQASGPNVSVRDGHIELYSRKPKHIPAGAQLVRVRVGPDVAVDVRALLRTYPSLDQPGGALRDAVDEGTDVWLPRDAFRGAQIDKVYATGQVVTEIRDHWLEEQQVARVVIVERFGPVEGVRPTPAELSEMPAAQARQHTVTQAGTEALAGSLGDASAQVPRTVEERVAATDVAAVLDPTDAALDPYWQEPYGSAEELRNDLFGYVTGSGTGDAGLLGPDLFGSRDATPRPDFLAGHDYTNLRAAEGLNFLSLLNMLHGVPGAEEMNPATWELDESWVIQPPTPRESSSWAPDATAAPLPDAVGIPSLVHAIWLGDPLANAGAMSGFWQNYANAARTHAGDAVFVLWTDLSRMEVESALNSPTRPDGGRAAEVYDMVHWAKDAGIALVNVHEVFNADTPMVNQAPFLSELSKRLGPGYAAASNILRLEVMTRFGGMYCDGDNMIRSLEGFDAVVASHAAFGIGMQAGGSANNAILLAPPEHPFMLRYRDNITEKYTRTQQEIFPPSFRTPHPGFFTSPLGKVHRNSVAYRTGSQVLSRLAQESGYEKARNLPSVPGITVYSDKAWLKESVRVPENMGRHAAVALAKNVVNALVRGLYNREGDLHLTAVASQVNRHARPELVWEAVLGFFAASPALRERVRGVTLVWMTAAPDGSEVEQELTLPPTASALLDFEAAAGQAPPIGDEQGRWLGERSTPVRLREFTLPPPQPAQPQTRPPDDQSDADPLAPVQALRGDQPADQQQRADQEQPGEPV